MQELTDLVRFVSNLAEELARIFADGIVDLVVNLLVNQFTNFVTAILWFSYWPDQTGSSTIVVFAIAYAGYLVGLGLARADATLSFQHLRRLFRGANNSAHNRTENGPSTARTITRTINKTVNKTRSEPSRPADLGS